MLENIIAGAFVLFLLYCVVMITIVSLPYIFLMIIAFFGFAMISSLLTNSSKTE